MRSAAAHRPAEPPDVAGGILRSLVARSPRMEEVIAAVRRIAPTNLNVLIAGEQGTGKAMIARLIHELSPRSGKPLVAVPCADTSPDGLFGDLFGWEGRDGGIRPGALEEAGGGTLVMEDVAGIPGELMDAIARAFERRSIPGRHGRGNIRIRSRLIATVNRRRGDRSNPVRSQFYFHFNPVVVEVPPLRERREDMPDLLAAVIEEVNARHAAGGSCSADALRCVLSYAWPGNFPQLRNAVAYAAVMSPHGGRIDLEHLPPFLLRPHPVIHPILLHAAGDGGRGEGAGP